MDKLAAPKMLPMEIVRALEKWAHEQHGDDEWLVGMTITVILAGDTHAGSRALTGVAISRDVKRASGADPTVALLEQSSEAAANLAQVLATPPIPAGSA
jgi:hypothetical protein